jgi:hypothetical protein
VERESRDFGGTVKTFRIESKDFLTCYKALRHSERIFNDAILRKDFPMESSEDEFLGYLADIYETKEKIEMIMRTESGNEVH